MRIAAHPAIRRFRSGALAALLLAWIAPSSNAAAVCTGQLAELQAYAGKYLSRADLLRAPALDEILARLPGDQRQRLQRNLDVSGPIQLADCHLAVAGNAPHMGTEQDAMLDVDMTSGTVTAAIHAGGRIDVYVLGDSAAAPRWEALPRGLREWAVRADMGFPQPPPRSLAQPGSVRLHALPATAVPATAVPRTTAKPRPINFDSGATQPAPPTPVQAAAIKRAAGDALTQPLPGHAGEPLYSMALADLNDDGRADLIVQYSYASGFCGSAGCSGIIVMATPQGYANKAIGMPNFTEVAVLPSMHGGMHDLQFDGDSPIWVWNGRDYEILKADRPQSHAPAWATRAAAGRTLALVVPIDSVIKSLSVFCDQGKPVLAMLLKMPRASQATTLTWGFNGWTVNVPMSPANRDGTLWMTYLSDSQLPQWLAHRGTDATSRAIAPLVTESYLRINGEMQGQISMQDSTAATRAALSGCYRY